MISTAFFRRTGASPMALVALGTWAWWLPLITLTGHWGDFTDKFWMTVTMVFGSFIAGATSEGGGAVAFPVMTLLFNIPPPVARDFAFMIQSVGMTSAALVIILTRTPVAWNAVLFPGLGGVVGLLAGLTWIAPLMVPAYTKMFFCALWLSFAVALHLVSLRNPGSLTEKLQGVSPWALVGVGILGGVVSSLVGSGLDIVTFSFLTLFARFSERVATPTSVVLMAGNALAGFFWRGAVMGAIAPVTWDYWFVCVPVVVIGAPLGALFIRDRTAGFIRRLLYFCIVVQFVGAALILPFSPALFLVGSLTFAGGAVFFGWLGWVGTRPSLRRRLSAGPPARIDSDPALSALAHEVPN